MKLLTKLKQIESLIESNQLALAIKQMKQLCDEEAACISLVDSKGNTHRDFASYFSTQNAPSTQGKSGRMPALTQQQVFKTFQQVTHFFNHSLEQEYFDETRTVVDWLEDLTILDHDHVLQHKEEELEHLVDRLEGYDIETLTDTLHLFHQFRKSLPPTTNEEFNEQLYRIEAHLQLLIAYVDYTDYLPLDHQLPIC